MRRILILLTSFAVSIIRADCRADGEDKTTIHVIGANVAATPSASITPPASTSDDGRRGVGDRTTAQPVERPATQLPPCAQAGPPVSLSSEFPQSFPFPPGTVITASRRAGVSVVVEGFIPTELREATRFFAQKLPAAGFQLGRSEEERHDAEARFMGKGVVGFLKVRTIPDCPRVLQFTVTVRTIEPVRSPPPE